MNEDALWKTVQEKVGPYGRLLRVENALGSGTPDVNYLLRRYPKTPPVCGWLELKYEPAFQKDGLRLKQLTKDQVLWHEDWASHGGRVFTLARVGKDHFLFDHDALRHIFTSPLSLGTVMSLSSAHWPHGFTAAPLIKCLTAT